MKKEETKLYFRNVDSTNCETIEDILHDAKLDELTEITVLEADPDNDTADHIWCNIYDAVSKCDCKKSLCSAYESKSGRGKCKNKGNLYFHGDEVTFNVETGELLEKLE
ncbi:hypothetical protein [Flavobacterium sp. FlaQc-50]|uniref:hypothetical protein n=1 Tax=unclassified Flavobacterium TaxID=196869 RepID=UPI0037568A9F